MRARSRSPRRPRRRAAAATGRARRQSRRSRRLSPHRRGDERRLFARKPSSCSLLHQAFTFGPRPTPHHVARAARRTPSCSRCSATGLHLSGMALLVPLLTPQNRDSILARARSLSGDRGARRRAEASAGRSVGCGAAEGGCAEPSTVDRPWTGMSPRADSSGTVGVVALPSLFSFFVGPAASLRSLFSARLWLLSSSRCRPPYKVSSRQRGLHDSSRGSRPHAPVAGDSAHHRSRPPRALEQASQAAPKSLGTQPARHRVRGVAAVGLLSLRRREGGAAPSDIGWSSTTAILRLGGTTAPALAVCAPAISRPLRGGVAVGGSGCLGAVFFAGWWPWLVRRGGGASGSRWLLLMVYGRSSARGMRSSCVSWSGGSSSSTGRWGRWCRPTACPRRTTGASGCAAAPRT